VNWIKVGQSLAFSDTVMNLKTSTKCGQVIDHLNDSRLLKDDSFTESRIPRI
jgi:hypothetical protein